MMVGRRRREPEQGHGSGISIGRDNIAQLQNVVGENISHVHQIASAESPVDLEMVRDLLAAFRTEVDRNAAALPNTPILRAMADDIDTRLTTPSRQAAGPLRAAAQALPALVAGTLVQQGGEALAQAIAGWLA